MNTALQKSLPQATIMYLQLCQDFADDNWESEFMSQIGNNQEEEITNVFDNVGKDNNKPLN